MKTYQKFVIPGVLLLVGLLAAGVALVSWFTRPELRAMPAGANILIATALVGVVVFIKNLVDIINGVRAMLPKAEPDQEKEAETLASCKTPHSQYFYDCYCKAPGKDTLSRAEFDQALWAYLDWVKREYNQRACMPSDLPKGKICRFASWKKCLYRSPYA
jgi:hypothetical protein